RSLRRVPHSFPTRRSSDLGVIPLLRKDCLAVRLQHPQIRANLTADGDPGCGDHRPQIPQPLIVKADHPVHGGSPPARPDLVRERHTARALQRVTTARRGGHRAVVQQRGQQIGALGQLILPVPHLLTRTDDRPENTAQPASQTLQPILESLTDTADNVVEKVVAALPPRHKRLRPNLRPRGCLSHRLQVLHRGWGIRALRYRPRIIGINTHPSTPLSSALRSASLSSSDMESTTRCISSPSGGWSTHRPPAAPSKTLTPSCGTSYQISCSS